METFGYLLILIGGIYITFNIVIAIYSTLKNKHISGTPLLGGIFIFFGIFILQKFHLSFYLLLPFLLDLSLVPSLIMYLILKNKGTL